MSPFLVLFLVCVGLGLVLDLCLCDLTELWSIEQLDDMIMSDAHGRTVAASQAAVIALYEGESCKRRLYDDIGFTDSGFPGGLHLQFAAFDRSYASSSPWFTWHPETMDAFYRYNVSALSQGSGDEWCPIIVYQSGNWSLPVQYFDKGTKQEQTLSDWVWDMLTIKEMQFENTLTDETVKLVFRYVNQGSEGSVDITNEQIVAVIPPQTKVVIDNLHAGDILVAQTESRGETINRYILDTVRQFIAIGRSTDPQLIDDGKFVSKYNSDYDLLIRRNWSTRRRYLNNIKSPPMMPQFTELGYFHGKAPKEICDYVSKFYNSNKGRRRVESFPKDGTQINAREIPTYMIHIPGDKKRWISEVMSPLLAEWSGVPLKYSTMYGLREYVRGAVLKGHVDRIETHIISAIIHVTHAPRNVSWPLEVVSWDGETHVIRDTDCDMIFYESSKLIHGRPSTYQGESWVNAFLHFRPEPWEGYTFTPQNVIRTPKAEKPLVDFVYG